MLGMTLPLFFVRLSPRWPASRSWWRWLSPRSSCSRPPRTRSRRSARSSRPSGRRLRSASGPGSRRRAGGYALFLVVIWRDPDPFGFGDLVAASLFSVGPWLAGSRSAGAEREADLELRASILEDEREAEARAAVAEERARIARELHDVIAHSVSVMTVQAGAARLLLAQDPEQARGPILAVEETGRRRSPRRAACSASCAATCPRPSGRAAAGDGEPRDARRTRAPRRASGRAHRRGRRGQARPGVDLAAYRVIQEALTNALKYAGPANAWVTVRYLSDALELEISNDGRSPERQNGSGGHGLAGMRERVTLYGGSVEAGPHPVRGFVVRARLPLEGAA